MRPEEYYLRTIYEKEAVDYMTRFDEMRGTRDENARRKSMDEEMVPLAAGDLSIDEDASFALMHMISMEEHLLMSSERTGETFYLDLLLSIRAERKRLLESMFGGKTPPGEIWCIAKHLLGCAMRLTETGTKKLSCGRRDEAKADFKAAVDMWGLFFVLTGKTGGVADDKKKETKTVSDSFPDENAGFAHLRGILKDRGADDAQMFHGNSPIPDAEFAHTGLSGNERDKEKKVSADAGFLSKMRERVMELVSCCIE